MRFIESQVLKFQISGTMSNGQGSWNDSTAFEVVIKVILYSKGFH